MRAVIKWTRRELIFFIILSTIVTVLYEILDVKWLQLPFTPVGVVGTAVAFLIGFQNNAAYDRIWEARKIWGDITNVSRSFVIMVKDSFYIHDAKNAKDEKETIRVITRRHVAWLTALRYEMRTKKPWEAEYKKEGKKKINFEYHIPEFENSLEEELRPYLSEADFEHVMRMDNKPNAIINLQSMHLRKLTDEGKVWDFSLLNMQGMLQEMTALQGKSERIKDFPYPKQYGSIGYHFVHIFMWLLPFAIIPSFASMGGDLAEIGKSYKFIGEYFIWLNIPFTALVIWVFNTMLRIGLAGENPFEGSVNDVPISNISREITRDILQLIEEAPEDIPEPLENVNDVHM